jgi:hypothetical protein
LSNPDYLIKMTGIMPDPLSCQIDIKSFFHPDRT